MKTKKKKKKSLPYIINHVRIRMPICGKENEGVFLRAFRH